MKNILEMHEFLLNERRASALTLLNDVVGGRTNSVEGIKLSVGMASAFLDWARMSPYGRKYNKLPFNMLFTAAFVWGLDRYVKGKDLKNEYKELKAKAKEMRKNESIEEGFGMSGLDHGDTMGILDIAAQYTSDAHAAANQMWSDVDDLVSYLKSDHIPRKYHKAFDKSVASYKKRHKLESVSIDESTAKNVLKDAIDALTKTIAGKRLNKAYVKDYLASIEKMAKKSPREFVKDYMNFSNVDWIEDVEYNMANEKVNEAKKLGIGDKGVDYNDNVVEIIAIGNFAKVAKMFKKEMKSDAEDYGYEKGPGQFYLTKNLEATEGNIGDYGIYPVKYDYANYYGLDPLKEGKKEDFKPHMMYDPKTGKGYKAETYEDHLRMDKMGYTHEKPEKVDEIRAKKVTKQMWKKFSDDKRFDALLSVIKDPDDAEEYVFMRWEELPGWMHRDMTLFEKEYSTEQRKEMASKGLALPDGSFPIKDIKDLKNAILSYGRSTDHSEVAKFIAKRAKALGAEDLIPDTENFQKALKETDKKGEYIPYYESFKESLLEKKPKGAPDFHHSDAPDAEGRFRDLSPKDLAAWLIKTRKKDLKKISGSLTQQVVFNRNDDPKYADKMEKTRIEVYKQLGREDLLDKKD